WIFSAPGLYTTSRAQPQWRRFLFDSPARGNEMTGSLSVAEKSMTDIIALCKRRGFIFQSSEIYGGLQGIYDYGPLGVELKNNLKLALWKANAWERDDMEGIDAAILMNKLT